VCWYQGEGGADPARVTAQARVDDGVTVNYGARANEAPIAAIMATLAVFGTLDFSAGDTEASAQHAAAAARATDRLDTEGEPQSVANVTAELAVASLALDRAGKRLAEEQALAEGLVAEVEGVSEGEVSITLLELQTRLQASYEVTSMLSQLSLVNYL
jgi:flagellar hook-associated protein 3 FlgL